MQEQEHDNKELCSKGCGFFGSPASGGMCSVCWKKHISNNQVKVASTSASSASSVSSSAAELTSRMDEIKDNKLELNNEINDNKVESTNDSEVSPVLDNTDKEKDEDKRLIQKNKKRCWECKKKVGYTGIECRCGYVYCGAHRYPDQHLCTYDYKTSGRQELAKRNPGGGKFSKMEKL